MINVSELDKNIKKLVQYGINSGLIPESERNYSTNMILDAFGKDDYSDPDISGEEINLDNILDNLLDIACEMKLIEDSITYRDLFDTKLMNFIMPRPSQVSEIFWKKYSNSPKEATDFYYDFSTKTNYIRKSRVEKDLKWTVPSQYGEIDITVNLSKPEKDPKAIAAAGKAASSSYPKCQLCMENEGYAGRVNHPARQNHRIIPVTINDSNWGFQYSPYVYYNEHCIVFNDKHIPMKIDKSTFKKLIEFTEKFPHYTLGSNADLPIVGGSILSHDHFQGGAYEFPMARAEYVYAFDMGQFGDVKAGILNWPMSVIRLSSNNKESLVNACDYILDKWRGYTDEEAFIYCNTDGEQHNTITPICRRKADNYEMDLVLRNNITTKECPWGVYHPSANLHHIKKENIGLIEVMGMAILPARLDKEMGILKKALLNNEDIRSISEIEKHAEWVESWKDNYDITSGNIDEIIKSEIGKVFVQVLECAGVYKTDEKGREAFIRFINNLT